MKRLQEWAAPLQELGPWLSGDPGMDRRRAGAHHAVRAGLLVVLALVTYLLFPVSQLSDFAGLERGVVAPQDIIAEFDFAVAKTEEELAREQGEAAAAVPPIFDYVPTAEDSVIGEVRDFFAGVDSVAQPAFEVEEPEPALLRAYLERNRISPPPGSMDLLVDTGDRDRFRRSIEVSVRQLYPQGVVETGTVREGTAPIYLRRGEDDAELVQAGSVLTPDRFYQLAGERLPDDFGPAAAELQRLVLSRFFQPSLVLNQAETEAARARARATVDPVRTTVLEGERIVAAREQIGEREEERLRAYQAALDDRGIRVEGQGNILPSIGGFLFNMLVISVLGLLLWFFRRELYHDMRSVLLLAALVAVTVAISSVIARFGLPVELIPVTFPVLILAALFGGRFALVLALVLALLVGGQQPFLGLTASFTAAMGGAAAAFSIRAVERRSKIWIFVTIISAAYVMAALTVGLLRSREISEIFYSMGFGVTNAIVSSLLAIGFLPLLESLTRITTDQTLLELSDLNRPRLKRLSLEATGTYAHTINVANLSEAAANAIGANGLLARVGAYYHDIGKMVKPQYFVENQPKGRNPHDKLKPSMSAAIIRSHVVEGLKMAEEDRLPEVIKAFIAEHHGTQQISFFYEKAREQDSNEEINPSAFSYPGPKPQSKETAIVMLADSVESAARVLQDPTPSRLRELVEKIVAGKISTGQLDQCPLTMREIDVAKDHLSKVLSGMYHHRIDYGSAGVQVTGSR